MTGVYGATVGVDVVNQLIQDGRLHNINHKVTSIAAATGASVYITVPGDKVISYFGIYFSSSGGVLDAYVSPVLSANGTPLATRNVNATRPVLVQAEAYHTPTITSSGGLFRSIGISGGTSVAGHGSTGFGGEPCKLVIAPGRYLLTLKPLADGSTVIFDLYFWEDCWR